VLSFPSAWGASHSQNPAILTATPISSTPGRQRPAGKILKTLARGVVGVLCSLCSVGAAIVRKANALRAAEGRGRDLVPRPGFAGSTGMKMIPSSAPVRSEPRPAACRRRSIYRRQIPGGRSRRDGDAALRASSCSDEGRSVLAETTNLWRPHWPTSIYIEHHQFERLFLYRGDTPCTQLCSICSNAGRPAQGVASPNQGLDTAAPRGR